MKRLYAAAPLQLRGTSYHRRRLAVVRKRFGADFETLDALSMFSDAEAWLAWWAAHARDLDALVLIPEPVGEKLVVGAGCVHEVFDARGFGIPVYVVPPRGPIVEEFKLLRRRGPFDARRCAVVALGKKGVK